MNKKLLYIISLCVIILVPLTTNTMSFIYQQGYFKIYNYFNPIYLFLVAVPVLIFLYINTLLKKQKKFTKIDILFIALAFVGIIVCVNAYDFKTSLLGSTIRYEGYITLLCYYLLFINWAKLGDIEDAKKWYKIIIMVSIVNVLYSLLQVYTDYEFIIRMKNATYASGLCRHNNFFGSLMAVALSMVSCKILTEKKDLFKNLILLFLFAVGLINCQSTGPVLAYFVTMLFMIIFLIIKKNLNWKRFAIIVLIPIIIFFMILFVNKVIFKNNSCELCDFKANVIDNGGHDRVQIWTKTFSVVKEYPLLGVGYDNLAYLYPNGYKGIKVTPNGIEMDKNLKYYGTYYLVDNAHNVYLNTHVSSGMIGLILYLGLCLITFIRGCQTKDKIYFILFAGFVAYSSQAFVNINTIEVAPIYYILIGLILNYNQKIKEH